jgi:hypothetical protein
MLALVLIAVVAIGIVGKSVDLDPGSGGAPAVSSEPSVMPPAAADVPDFLRHRWARPMPITPNTDRWGSGFLRLSSGFVDHGPAPGPAASRSALTAAGIDRLIVTATADTKDCSIGDVGEYRWSIGGKGTVMTLEVVGSDACTDREPALAGQWVRSDYDSVAGAVGALPPGMNRTSAFDPLRTPGAPMPMAYTVGPGWEVVEDQPTVFVLHDVPAVSESQPPIEAFLFFLGQPRVAADIEPGTSCSPFTAAPDIGDGVEQILAAITMRPGVASTRPAAVSIDGFDGQIVDLGLATDWRGGCDTPEGPVVGVPLLVGAGTGVGPTIGLGVDRPIRLVLLDLGQGRTMSIAMVLAEPSLDSSFAAWVASAMPVVESLRFHATTP